MKILIPYTIGCLLTAVCLTPMMITQNSEIELLTKQLNELECYRDNYLIMADSIQNIHNKCFKIGN